jgi:hypothetical protein
VLSLLLLRQFEHNDNTIILLANNDSENRKNKKKYLHYLFGTLMYATKSRPDIKFSTSLVATKSSNPLPTISTYHEVLI